MFVFRAGYSIDVIGLTRYMDALRERTVPYRKRPGISLCDAPEPVKLAAASYLRRVQASHPEADG
jgi:hypothetical protein